MPRMQLGMYATTKAALSHFCRNLALEIAPLSSQAEYRFTWIYSHSNAATTLDR